MTENAETTFKMVELSFLEEPTMKLRWSRDGRRWQAFLVKRLNNDEVVGMHHDCRDIPQEA